VIPLLSGLISFALIVQVLGETGPQLQDEECKKQDIK